MVDFISEVQEELRKDDYNKWLKQYGPFILGGIFIVIAITGVMEWRKASQQQAASETSSIYLAASQMAAEGNDAAAKQAFLDLSQEAPDGYSGLALMQASALEVEAGNLSQAVNLLDQAAQTFERPRHQQLAQIKAIYILAGLGDYENVIRRAGPLAELGQPYEFLAREALGFSALQIENYEIAQREFRYLERTPGVPSTIQGRARQHLAMVPDLPTVDVETSNVSASDSPTDETPQTPDADTDTPDMPATESGATQIDVTETEETPNEDN